jgi:hypothetical protein
MAQDKINKIEERINNVKTFGELKNGLASFCKVMVESFDLESCLVHFYELNPILLPFAVSYPASEYENTTENEIKEIDLKLTAPQKSLVIIPILHNAKKTGALICLPQNDGIPSALLIDELKNSAGNIANSINKIAGIETKKRMMEFIQKYIRYKKRIGIVGQARDDQIIYKLLSSIIAPTRLYIEIESNDGSQIFHHAMAGPEGISECFYGKYEDSQFECLLDEIKRDEYWAVKVEIKEHGQAKGKIFIQYEQSGSFVDDEVKKTLQTN